MVKAAASSCALEALVDERERAAPRHDDDEDIDDITGDDLRKLNEAVAESEAQFERGEGIPAEVVLAKMRRRLYGA